MLSIFEERNVRMIWNKGRTEIWFSAIDVGEELGIVNIRDTLRNIDRTEKKKFKNEEISGVGVLYTRNFEIPLNNYGETFVSEEAVYNMSFRSNKPEAKLFTKWVTKVLKQIRVNGYYVADEESNKWLKTRTETKQVRRMETDTIKRFVEYAKSQGSTNAEQYYMNFTKLVQNHLGIDSGSRDNQEQKMLLRLKSFETIVDMRLDTLMKLDMPYKDIYSSVRDLIQSIQNLGGFKNVAFYG